jgi:hypothetical protein
MITGLEARDVQNLQLNAGVFLKNFDYSEITDAGALETAVLALLTAGTGILGATKGGGSFQATPTIRNIEVDVMRAPVIGSTVNDGWTVKMTGTMVEITPENFASALISADVATVGDVTTVKIRNEIESGDYIDSLCWVGDTSAGGFVLINLTKALNLTGGELRVHRQGRGLAAVRVPGASGEPRGQRVRAVRDRVLRRGKRRVTNLGPGNRPPL